MTTNTSTQPQSTYAAYALPGGSTTETGLDRLLAALHRGPFVRSTTNAKVAGACASIADRTGLAPKVVRIGTIVLAVFGVAVPLYLGAWLLTPDTAGRLPAERALRGGESKAIALAVLFALVVVATQGSTGFTRVLVGSVAETVTRSSPCSVLVVRGTKP